MDFSIYRVFHYSATTFLPLTPLHPPPTITTYLVVQVVSHASPQIGVVK
jgi:hypothetical protein